ncbi:MAG: VTC domain-containing protein [Bdellovibrionales bacterium]
MTPNTLDFTECDLSTAEKMNVAPSELPTDLAADSFVRIEDKFFIPGAIQAQTIEFLEQHMVLSYPDGGSGFTIIESIYFDSQEMDLFQHHFNKPEKRSKLRIRRYAPRGVWNEETCFIEAKTKTKKGDQSVSSKERFKLDPTNLDLLMKAQTISISNKLLSLNKNLNAAELLRRVEMVNDLVNQYQLVPQMRVRYERLAFEGKESSCTESLGMKGGIRVTLDKGIVVERLTPFRNGLSQALQSMGIWAEAEALGKVFSCDETVIMEVKHRGVLPSWLDAYLKSQSISKVSFSKYCWGVAQQVKSIGVG